MLQVAKICSISIHTHRFGFESVICLKSLPYIRATEHNIKSDSSLAFRQRLGNVHVPRLVLLGRRRRAAGAAFCRVAARLRRRRCQPHRCVHMTEPKSEACHLGLCACVCAGVCRGKAYLVADVREVAGAGVASKRASPFT